MIEGDIILTPMPPFQDALVCGISTQTHQLVPDSDELITSQDNDFTTSGLVSDSLIRLGFLAVLPRRNILGSIGSLSPERHKRLLQRLSAYLVKSPDQISQ
jgi:mRNA interferase MazF